MMAIEARKFLSQKASSRVHVKGNWITKYKPNYENIRHGLGYHFDQGANNLWTSEKMRSIYDKVGLSKLV